MEVCSSISKLQIGTPLNIQHVVAQDDEDKGFFPTTMAQWLWGSVDEGLIKNLEAPLTTCRMPTALILWQGDPAAPDHVQPWLFCHSLQHKPLQHCHHTMYALLLLFSKPCLLLHQHGLDQEQNLWVGSDAWPTAPLRSAWPRGGPEKADVRSPGYVLHWGLAQPPYMMKKKHDHVTLETKNTKR